MLPTINVFSPPSSFSIVAFLLCNLSFLEDFLPGLVRFTPNVKMWRRWHDGALLAPLFLSDTLSLSCYNVTRCWLYMQHYLLFHYVCIGLFIQSDEGQTIVQQLFSRQNSSLVILFKATWRNEWNISIFFLTRENFRLSQSLLTISHNDYEVWWQI